MTNYQDAKSQLILISYHAKEQHTNDKPLIRMMINDSAYMLSIDLKLSEYQTNLLSNYACTLHPKN
jgi:hypothetical protein